MRERFLARAETDSTKQKGRDVAGEEIGGYRLDSLLGRGTMGFVYLAHRIDDPTLQVAIKRVHTLASADDRERLRREAITMRRLDHPNIIRVLEVIDGGEESDNGDLALVMPYASGGTLAHRLAEHGAVRAHEVVEILSVIADALAHAHRHDIVHRDVKPSNILFDAEGHALLADFGIARNAAQTNLTRTDLAIGTAAYLDPEVADGAEPSPFSDQYSLGVVAYEALTGRPPYSANTPLGVLRAADKAIFEPLDRTVFGVLAVTIERAFARQPDERFLTIEAYAAALNGSPFVESESGPIPQHLDETTTFRRRARPASLDAAPPVSRSRRRSLLLGSAATVIALAVGGLGFQRTRQHSLRALPVPALPKCSPQTNAQCVGTYVRTTTGIKVNFAAGDSAEFRFGRSSDAIRVANFFCGERATAALYQPDDGIVYYLSNWPDPASDERSEVSFDATGITGGKVSVGDTDHDGCADLAVDSGRTRTWFLPSTQTKRLQLGNLKVTSMVAK